MFQLHRLSSAPRGDSFRRDADGQAGIRAHAQRVGTRDRTDAGRAPREPSAARRIGRDPASAAALHALRLDFRDSRRGRRPRASVRARPTPAGKYASTRTRVRVSPARSSVQRTRSLFTSPNAASIAPPAVGAHVCSETPFRFHAARDRAPRRSRRRFRRCDADASQSVCALWPSSSQRAMKLNASARSRSRRRALQWRTTRPPEPTLSRRREKASV